MEKACKSSLSMLQLTTRKAAFGGNPVRAPYAHLAVLRLIDMARTHAHQTQVRMTRGVSDTDDRDMRCPSATRDLASSTARANDLIGPQRASGRIPHRSDTEHTCHL